MSETRTPTIFEIFAAAKREVRAVGKSERNQQQNFNFRGIDAVVNAAAPALDKHGVITAPVLDEIEYTTVEIGQKRTPMAHVRVKVTYHFHGPAGDHFDATVPGEAMDSGDKATAKAMSVAYRIALIQALNLPTTDQDSDTQTYERSPRESFESAQPARPRQASNGNGAPRGQVARPAQPEQPSVPSSLSGEIDPDAQEFANEAHECRTVKELAKTHAKAMEDKKLQSFIADPATGTKGALGPYLNFRRKVLADVEKAWSELNDAAGRHRTDLAELEIQLKRKTGANAEAATPAQIREFIATLDGAAA